MENISWDDAIEFCEVLTKRERTTAQPFADEELSKQQATRDPVASATPSTAAHEKKSRGVSGNEWVHSFSHAFGGVGSIVAEYL